MIAGYQKVWRFAIPFSDIDMLRHANNLAYARWAEQTRTEYMAEVLEEDIFGHRGMIIARLEVTYVAPVFYRERIAVGCRAGRIGTKSFEIEHEIWSEDRDILACRIGSTLVAFDYDASASIPVPAEWRAKIAAFEGSAGTVAPPS